jgi:flagellar basal body-associated protein FliL
MASEEDTDAPKKPSMLPLILAAVGALVVGAGGGFGVALMLPASEDAEAAEDTDGGGSKPEEPLELTKADGTVVVVEDPEAPFIHDLGKFTINLRGGGGGRTLRMQVQIVSRAQYQVDLEEKTPALRDAVLTLSSDFTYGDIEGLDGKQRLKDDLLASVLKLVEPKSVERILFTEFVAN